jgi:hypothetical protein
MGNAAAFLDRIGDVMKDEVKAATPEGTVSRPIYKRGPYKGKWWTARDAGGLKRSARVQRKGEGRTRNIWVMLGNTKHYYGKIINFGTNGNRHKGFFQKAINRGKRRVRQSILGGGK